MRHKTGARMPRADMQRVFALTVEIPTDVEEQMHIASRLNQQMLWVIKAKDACRRQEELMDRIAQKLLSEFPYSNRDTIHSHPIEELQ